MKLTALALIILALGIVLGLTLRGTGTEAAPKFATTQFVDDSIEAFNQAVVQPIGAAVTDLDQRVTALENASPPSTQQREDQVMMFAGGGRSSPCEESVFHPVGTPFCPPRVGAEQLAAIELDAADYPTGTSFRLEVTALVTTNSTLCFRLFDNTASLQVTGSEICRSNSDPSDALRGRFRSATFSLTDAPHEYVTQIKGVGNLIHSRIIVEWTE